MWRAQWGRHLVLALVSVASAAVASGAQVVVGVDPTAAEVATALRTKGHSAGARAVLTQARGPRATREMDEVADTLVSIAASFRGSGIAGVSTRLAALSALASAGRGDTGINDGTGGIPYAGAAERLKRLATTAQSGGIRAAALRALVSLPDSVTHFSFLGEVAASASDETAQAAMTLLVNDTGPVGLAIARKLYIAGSVTQWSARRTLDGAAQQFGWRRP